MSLLGGRISVTSVEKKGSVFTLELPLVSRRESIKSEDHT